eukprot:6314585-Amphidinium_carterae.1
MDSSGGSQNMCTPEWRTFHAPSEADSRSSSGCTPTCDAGALPPAVHCVGPRPAPHQPSWRQSSEPIIMSWQHFEAKSLPQHDHPQQTTAT